MNRARRLPTTPPPARATLPALAAALGGAALGLAASRLLFDLAPWTFGPLGDLPGALALAALGAVGAWALVYAQRTPPDPARWAPLALLLVTLLAPTINPLRDLTLLLGALVLVILLLTSAATEPNSLFSLFLFLFLFSLYLATLAPAVGEADTFEFQVGITRLGIAHGSGYPLLMLVGKLFTLLPLGGTLAWRANLTSAFFGALAGVGVERVARKLGAGALPALLAGLAFGVSPTLWSRAVEVEAYTLNAALVAALLWLSLRLIEPPPAAPRLLSLTALLFGLSLTNHLTTLLLAPAVGLAALNAIWLHVRALPATDRWRTALPLLARLIGFGLLGLLIYLYLPLRWPAVNNGELMSWAQFTNILSGNEAKGAFQWALPLRDVGRYGIVAFKLASEYGALPLLAAGLGLAALTARAARQRRLVAPPLILALAYLPYLYFALAFNVPDPDFSAFFIPLHLIAAALMGVGLQAALTWLETRANRPLTPLAGNLLLTAAALLPLANIWINLPRVTQAGDWAAQRLGELMLRQPLAPDAAILADSQKIAPLYYLQVAEGVRPDLDILVLPDEASYRAVLDERLAAGQTVYLGRYLPGLGAGYSLRSVGPLAEVSPAPFTQPAVSVLPPLANLEADSIKLLGYAPESGSALGAAAPNNIYLSLVWQAAATPSANWLVNLRLVDSVGAVAWQSAGSVPVSGLYPTNAWRPGEVISDFYAIPLAPTFTPGAYQLQVGLFPPFAAADTGWAAVAPVTVQPAAVPPTPSHLLRARIGDHWLAGYDAPLSAAPGATVPVTLYWFHRDDGPVQLSGEVRDLSAWPRGLAPLTYAFTAPASDQAWSIALRGNGPSVCGWLQRETDTCALPAINVQGDPGQGRGYDFAGLLRLLEVKLGTPSAAPGGQVPVTLTWLGQQPMSEDYTVFVHLLGPDGLVHGQVDAWPVSGTRATSGWAVNETISDPYTIQVPADAPPGDYQVEVGLYLLATNERLPVLNAAGQPVDDRVLTPGLTITP